jgi:hypothetical protein
LAKSGQTGLESRFVIRVKRLARQRNNAKEQWPQKTQRGKAATKTGLNRQNDFEAESFLFPGKWSPSFCLQMILPNLFKVNGFSLVAT